MKNRELKQKEKIWKSKNVDIDLHLKDGLGVEFTAITKSC